MKEIQLTQGQIAIVDEWNYEELSKYKWFAMWSDDTKSFYAARHEGKHPFRKTVYMHRYIMNTPKGMLCDHINHDTLYNVESNLRNTSQSQSQMNKKTYSNNKLGERCISRDRSKFRVQIEKDREIVFRKNFNTLDEAIIARDIAIVQYHGDFAFKSGDET